MSTNVFVFKDNWDLEWRSRSFKLLLSVVPIIIAKFERNGFVNVWKQAKVANVLKKSLHGVLLWTPITWDNRHGNCFRNKTHWNQAGVQGPPMPRWGAGATLHWGAQGGEAPPPPPPPPGRKWIWALLKTFRGLSWQLGVSYCLVLENA